MTDKKLYELCREYGSKIRFWKKKFVALLPEVAKRKLYKKYNFYSLYEFAAKLGGVGKKTVDEILRTYRRVEDKPLLKDEIEKSGWGKVRTVISLIENTEEEDLVNMIRSMPKAALEETVRQIKKQGSQHETPVPATPPGWGCVTVSFKIDKDTDFKLRKFQQKLEKKRKQKVPFNEVLKALLTEVEGKSTETKKPSGRISATKRRETQNRCHGKCEFGDCNKPGAEYHHPERFSLTKNHEKIVFLCEKHHKIAHSGLIENESDPPKEWRISKKPDKTSLTYRIDQKVQQYSMGWTG